MSDTGTLASLNNQPEDPGGRSQLVELHWMKTPSIELAEAAGISAQALCGKWMEPDEALAERITADETPTTEYVSCLSCELLHHHNVRADRLNRPAGPTGPSCGLPGLA